MNQKNIKDLGWFSNVVRWKERSSNEDPNEIHHKWQGHFCLLMDLDPWCSGYILLMIFLNAIVLDFISSSFLSDCLGLLSHSSLHASDAAKLLQFPKQILFMCQSSLMISLVKCQYLSFLIHGILKLFFFYNKKKKRRIIKLMEITLPGLSWSMWWSSSRLGFPCRSECTTFPWPRWFPVSQCCWYLAYRRLCCWRC